jgi:hypothetical protein
MDVLALLKTCKARDIRLTVADATLHCDAPTGALTEEVRAAIARHKGDLLALLTSPPPGEAAAAACTHTATYRRPSGVLVCLDCAATLAPGAATWEDRQVAYCLDGQHVPYPDDLPDHPRQCQRCPYVWPQIAPEAPTSTTPAQTALPLGSGVPHGEVPPQRKVRR